MHNDGTGPSVYDTMSETLFNGFVLPPPPLCRQYGPNGSFPLLPASQSPKAAVYINRYWVSERGEGSMQPVHLHLSRPAQAPPDYISPWYSFLQAIR